jgi:hypothetical protein
MSKILNTKEAMQALLDGKKIRGINWPEDHVVELDEYGFLRDRLGHFLNKELIESFEIYEQPKPKKEVWQWRFRDGVLQNWNVDHELRTESEAASVYKVDHEKHAGPFEVSE